MKLADLAALIRSKNAGPFALTFDIMFTDQASCPEEKVRFFQCDNALAFKFSIPRPLTQGDPGDGDMHGGQQFVPLMNLEIG